MNYCQFLWFATLECTISLSLCTVLPSVTSSISTVVLREGYRTKLCSLCYAMNSEETLDLWTKVSSWDYHCSTATYFEDTSTSRKCYSKLLYHFNQNYYGPHFYCLFQLCCHKGFPNLETQANCQHDFTDAFFRAYRENVSRQRNSLREQDNPQVVSQTVNASGTHGRKTSTSILPILSFIVIVTIILGLVLTCSKLKDQHYGPTIVGGPPENMETANRSTFSWYGPSPLREVALTPSVFGLMRPFDRYPSQQPTPETVPHEITPVSLPTYSDEAVDTITDILTSTQHNPLNDVTENVTELLRIGDLPLPSYEEVTGCPPSYMEVVGPRLE